MPNRTKQKDGQQMTAYTTRHLRRDLLKMARVEAALGDETIEYVINEALAIGLPELRRRRIGEATKAVGA